MERLIIKKFGPIKELDIEIKPLTIFIGKSGSGKSVVLKTLSMFRWIYKRVNIRAYLRNSNIKTRIRLYTDNLMSTSGLIEFLSDETYIEYIRDNYSIKLERKKISTPKKIDNNNISIEKVSFISDKRAVLADYLSPQTRGIPTYYLQDTIDSFYTAINAIQEYHSDNLNVSIKFEKAKIGIAKYRIFNTEDKYSVSFKNSSSGTQTSIPISVIIKYLSNRYSPKDSMSSSIIKLLADDDKLASFSTTLNVGDISNIHTHVIIEEPELSLFPSNQVGLINEIVSTCFENENKNGMTLAMSTHSPYILVAINNMIQKGDILKKGYTTAYSIIDGRIDCLIDTDTNLISASYIDEISEQLNEEFDNLLYQ